MPERIYLTSSTGVRYEFASGPNDAYLGDLIAREIDLVTKLRARAKREIDLASVLRTSRGEFYLDLVHDMHAFTKSGYKLYAKNIASGVETYLGFVPDAAPLQLAGVNLADGKYEIRTRGEGYYWQDQRYNVRFEIEVAGGVFVQALPTLSGLEYRYLSDTTLFLFNWIDTPGTTLPTDFAIWTGAAEPVSTAGAPTHVLPATVPGNYSVELTQGAAILYVAACARNGATKGPIATLAIPAPPITLNSPDQFADYR